ncbi:tetratricopeptide repeat protein [Clostridium sp. 'deep sea']|uniref:tetratricopeptide repeat protein n=1 Tax=Clostridium sp. 'deep sea' TaxID=2779445 RepID=UPI001896492E|nr:tetratricopeptide repeat protein [Clostridium sp. 'deep sea']QOR33819.1 tetratricopeptide repeat protein [Clostridium sp. 'deep sea']
MLLGVFLVLVGLFCWFAALTKVSFFWESRKAKNLRKIIGDAGARILYLVLGLVIIGSGIFLGGMKVYESRADKLYDQGSYQEGLDIYYKLHSYLKDDINYMNGIAFGNFMLENYEESQKYAELSVSKNKKENQDANVLLAWSLARQNKLDEAIAALKHYLQEQPESGFIYSELGNLYYINNQLEESADNYKKAIEFDADNGKNYLNLAEVYYKDKKYQEEIAVYNKMIENSIEVINVEHDDTYKTVYYNIGVSYYKIENYEKSEESFSKSLELDNGNADCWYFLASSQAVLKKKPAEVLKSLEECFKLNKEYVEVVKTDADFSTMLQYPQIIALIEEYSKK